MHKTTNFFKKVLNLSINAFEYCKKICRGSRPGRSDNFAGGNFISIDPIFKFDKKNAQTHQKSCSIPKKREIPKKAGYVKNNLENR